MTVRQRALRLGLRLVACLVPLAVMAPPTRADAQATASPCAFRGGFAVLREMITPTVAGDCLEDERTDPGTGDALQRTTKGLFRWYRAGDWTSFDDGRVTFFDGPFGFAVRPNGRRMTWEEYPDMLPRYQVRWLMLRAGEMGPGYRESTSEPIGPDRARVFFDSAQGPAVEEYLELTADPEAAVARLAELADRHRTDGSYPWTEIDPLSPEVAHAFRSTLGGVKVMTARGRYVVLLGLFPSAAWPHTPTTEHLAALFTKWTERVPAG